MEVPVGFEESAVNAILVFEVFKCVISILSSIRANVGRIAYLFEIKFYHFYQTDDE